MAGKHRVIRHHPITPKRLACGGLAGAAILGSLAVPVAAFANPTDDDEPHIVKQLGADWIPMGEKDTETTYATHPDGWTPPEPQATGDDQAKFDAAKAAGFPGFEPDKGGSKGIEEVTQPDPSAPVSGHNWDGVAQYESSGDWAANTGNGYYGGLQIWPPTWIDFGGWEFAALPHEATKEQQIIVAERILAVQGKEAWPNCGQYLQDAAPNPPADLTAPCSDHNVSFSEANMQPGSIKLARAICAVFGDRLDIIGGWRPYDAISQDHPSGHAIDIMIPDYSTPEGSQLGSDVAGWVMDHAAEYGVQYLIHKQTYWQPDGYSYVMEDRGSDTQNHYDHVHVTLL